MKDDMKQLIEWLWEKHRGSFLGALGGALLGVAVLLFGVFATLFVLFCTGVGVWLGRRVDSGESDWLERFRDWKMADYRRWKS
ncbi:MAG: DUF2273 domain-containing protein [Schwartzia sp. (in: firmicutes)]